MAYFVSNWMRLVSTGDSPGSTGTMLGARVGGGVSTGLGWVKVNGSSTARSLQIQSLHRSLQTQLLHVFANNYCTGLCKQLLHRSLQTQSLHRSLQTIIAQISANTITAQVSANNHCSRARSLQTCKHHPWWLTSDHWLATSQRRSCTADKSLLPGLSDTESFQHH